MRLHTRIILWLSAHAEWVAVAIALGLLAVLCLTGCAALGEVLEMAEEVAIDTAEATVPVAAEQGIVEATGGDGDWVGVGTIAGTAAVLALLAAIKRRRDKKAGGES